MIRLPEVVRSIGTLMSGSVLGQLLALAAYPVVTRLFSPDDFGLFNVFYSYIEVMIILSTGKYELAFPIVADHAEAAALLRFTRRLNALVSVLLLTVIAMLVVWDALPGESRSLGFIALLIPPVVFFAGNVRIHSFLFNRYQQYYPIAVSSVVYGGATSLFKIGFGLLARFAPLFSRLGLPLATVLGQAAADLNYVVRLRRLPTAHLPRASRQEMWGVARKYRNFPLYVLPKDWINSFSFNLPFIWMALYFDHEVVGFFALALTVTFRPVNIASGDIERVLYVRIHQNTVERKPIGAFIGKFLLRVNMVALPAFAILFFFAEPIFGWVFGSQWAPCAVYVRWLAPWCYLSLNTSVLSFIPNIFSTQRTEFLFILLLFGLWAGSMLAGILSGDFLLGIALYALSGMLVAVMVMVWYLWQVRRYDQVVEA